MPDIPNRDELERLLARKLGRLFSAFTGHLMELLEEAGWDINKLPSEVWAQMTAQERAILLPFLRKVALQASEAMLETIPIGVDWALVNENAAGWAQTYSTFLAGQIDQTSRRAVASSIRNSISAFYEEGLTMGDLIARMEADPNLMRLFTKDIRDSLGRVYGPRRAAMIARTEVTRAAMQGEALIAQELAAQGIHMIAVWQTRNDELVCPICGPRHGKDKGDGWYVEEPAHPNCLPGNTLVLPVGGVSAGSKRWYEGDVVTIETLENKLTVTPNHPILTDTGWVAAGDISEGDNVICYKSSEWEAALIQVDNQNSISAINDKFGALDILGFRVPTTAPDFHGDGAGSNIAVIRTNSQIVNDGDTDTSQPLSEPDFVGRYVVSQTSLSPISPFAEFIKTDFATTGGFMGSGNLVPPLDSTHSFPLESFGFGLATGLDTGGNYPTTESPAINASLFRKSILTLTGKIAVQKVVKVRNKNFAGHVYNLQTDSGLYVAAGIITHNCRCWINHRLPEVVTP